MQSTLELFATRNDIKPTVKVDYEFQAICLEMQEHFGIEYKKRIWPLPYRFPLGKIKDAWIAYGKGNVKTFNYYCGILNKI